VLDSADIVRDMLFPRRFPCCGFCGDANHRMNTCEHAAKAEAARLARRREDEALAVLHRGLPIKDRE
jgi:hypothetical protein